MLLFVLSLTIIISTICTAAFAHSGKTDEDGGHYDNSTGEYHYHHGYPAHQHENGMCPYDYNDNTNYQYSNSKESKLSQPIKIGIIVTISIIVFCVLSYILFLVMRKEVRKKKCMKYINILKPQLEQITNDENRIRFQIRQQISYSLNEVKQKENNIDNLYEKIKQTNPKKYYEYHYGNKTIEYAAKFPEGVYINEGCLIDLQSNEFFGRFTGYILSTGKVVHADRGCSGAYEPIHMVIDRHIISKRKPCSKCMILSPKCQYFYEIPEWYINYLNIKKIKTKYDIK